MQKVSLSCFIMTLFLVCQGGELLKNSDFEGGLKLVPGLNKKYPEHWSGGWKDKNIPELITEKEAQQGKKYVRLKDCTILQKVKIGEGKSYCCWYWARGNGKLRMMFYMYGKKPNGKEGYLGTGGGWKPLQITPEWRLYRKFFVLPNDNVNSMAVAFSAIGEVEIDTIFFRLSEDVVLLTQFVAFQTRLQEQLKQFAGVFQDDQVFREKFSPEIEKINEGVSVAVNELKLEKALPLQREFELKQKLDRMSRQMGELIEKIKFEEVLR